MRNRSESIVRFLFAAILLSALGLRVWWFQKVNTQPVTDFDWYFERAKELAQGLGYQVDGNPTAYWPPGYPLALSLLFKLTGPTVFAAKILNSALTIIIVAQTYLLGRRLHPNPVLALLAALITALFPPLVAYSTILASEPLYTALILAGCLFLYNPKTKPLHFIYTGIVFSLATLVRPQAILILLFVLPIAWLFQRSNSQNSSAFRLTSISILVATFALVQTPWMIRNITIYKKPVFVSTNGGDNLWIGHNPNSTGKYMDPGGRPAPPAEELKNDKAQKNRALTYLQENPRRFLFNAKAKLTATFLETRDVPYWAFQLEKGHLSIPGIGADKAEYKWSIRIAEKTKPWLIYASIIGSILALLSKQNRKQILLPIAMAGSTALLAVAFFGNPRFGFSVLPFQAIAAGFIPVIILGWYSKKRPEAETESASGLDDLPNG